MSFIYAKKHFILKILQFGQYKFYKTTITFNFGLSKQTNNENCF